MTVEGGIAAIRRALHLGDDEAALVRSAAPRLSGEVDRWVEQFYYRLVVDPVAMAVLRDEAMVVRLKRSLAAWAHEWMTLPWDEAYQRARAEIGRVHVRIGLPQHLMVTAMGGVRRDVVASVQRLWTADPAAAAAISRAVEKVLDLELALMLGQFDRRRREVERERSHGEDRARYGRRVERAIGEGVDAALCYAHLVRAARDGAERETWLARLEAAVRALHGTTRRAAPAVVAEEPERSVAISSLASAALAEVSLAGRTDVSVSVSPPELEARVRESALQYALVELLQNAANHDPGGRVRLSARSADGGGLVIEVTDGGPGWPLEVDGVDELPGAREGLGLAVAEDVALTHGGRIELFAAPGGGAGVRLRLPPAAVPEPRP